MTGSDPTAEVDGIVADRGAGSILALALVAVILAVLSMLLPLVIVLDAKQRASGAADSAALAAADTAVGIRGGFPCPVAESVAAANEATVTECQVDGLVVTVRVSVPAAGFLIPSAATAGPPDSGTD
ncbi:MAG: hypothetical protein JWL94_2049 [Microbacteriaceae bacterium]|jgi:secretion/DNA translocation related TadE-like protein|nr:hypothetical protein [Microbacteriaceae bacterium]HEV7956959.1 Rv3654c family TadE-like protein [Marisediminicola sp.]